MEYLLWTSYSAKYCGREGNLTSLVLHLRPLMIWFLPGIPPLNLLPLLHIPVAPHIHLPELLFRVALCHLPSVHFLCHSPAIIPSALLSAPVGLAFLSFVVWSPLPQACSGTTHPTASVAGCALQPFKPRDTPPASLLWSSLIFTLCFRDLCALLEDMSSF